jgi:translation initiation factor IF-1
MAKDDQIEVEGVIKHLLPGSVFHVELTTEGLEGVVVEAHLSGKMRMYYIRIVEGDRVQVTLSPDSIDKGRITYRFK